MEKLLISQAEQDLKSSLMLYERGFIYLSYYYFQKAVEYVNSASLLLTKGYDETEIQIFGVVSPEKCHSSVAGNQQGTQSMIEYSHISDYHSFTKFKIEYCLDLINVEVTGTDSLKIENMAQFSSVNIKSSIENLKKIYEFELNKYELSTEMADSIWRGIIDWVASYNLPGALLFKFLVEEYLEDDSNKADIMRLTVKWIAAFVDAYFVDYTLNICTLANIYRHSVPIAPGKIGSDEFKNHMRIIMDNYTELFKLMEQAIFKLRKLMAA